MILAGANASTGSEITAAERQAVQHLIDEQVGTGRSADDQGVSEARDARRMVTGTGEASNTNVLVVEYTLETGNSWQIYLAIFDRASLQVLASGRIGGKEYREATLQSVRGGVISVKTMNYAPDDASCCPTIPGRTIFEVRGGHLWETDTRVGRARPTKRP
jgi:hypothetical protein